MLILREIRNKKRITLEELAEKSGISRRMISAYESHQNDITYTRMKQLAEALGVHVLELTDEYVEPTAPIVNVQEVEKLVDKLTDKDREIQMMLETISVYKKQVQLLEVHNKGLLTTTQLLEEKVLDLSAKLTHYECRGKGNSRIA